MSDASSVLLCLAVKDFTVGSRVRRLSHLNYLLVVQQCIATSASIFCHCGASQQGKHWVARWLGEVFYMLAVCPLPQTSALHWPRFLLACAPWPDWILNCSRWDYNVDWSTPEKVCRNIPKLSCRVTYIRCKPCSPLHGSESIAQKAHQQGANLPTKGLS